ncbi:MAG: replicative DNA helicase [Parcubacteria group bacterium CG11_big_fil_rev_8_21_14_0_20_39_22]|nr:MAG: replicative DNA helicase [Parcubacteria group bacterium CG11_big_fil_rev_8_21_14_0_20_39_22]
MTTTVSQGISNKLRIPPQSIEAEMALLGSLMLRPDAMYEVIDFIKEDVFYSEKHRIVWRSIFELFSKNTPVDLLSLSTRLKEKKQLDQIGGATFLTELVNTVPSSANVKYYAELVQKKHMMRNLIEASEFISHLGYDESGELDELIDKAEKKIYEITNGVNSSAKFIQIKDTLAEAWERLDTLHKSNDEIRGVHSGFKEIDNKLAGFQKSDLIILAARPSMGKTSLALDIARQSAILHNTSVGIFSLEMSSQQLVDRMLAADSRVDSWKLRTGKLSTDAEFDKLRESLDKLSKAPIYIDDQPGTNILKMRSVARRLKRENGLGLIVVDYLQLMTPTQSRGSDNVVQQTTEISRSLKQLARELDVPVLALSQLSRAVEQRGGKPRLSDLRDSGSIEQDADVVMFIHRERNEEGAGRNNSAEILIEKHRNGPTGKVDLYFDEQKATFLSMEKADFSDFNTSSSVDDDF